MAPADMYDALMQIFDDIGRLRPDWRDSEEFYALRSSIKGRIRSLANSPLATRKVSGQCVSKCRHLNQRLCRRYQPTKSDAV